MASQPYSALRLKIEIVTLCFSLIPLFALGLTIYYQFSGAYSNRIKDEVRTLAENERTSIEMFLDERVAQHLVRPPAAVQQDLRPLGDLGREAVVEVVVHLRHELVVRQGLQVDLFVAHAAPRFGSS